MCFVLCVEVVRVVMFVACFQDYLDVAVTSDSLELPPGQLVVLGYDAKVTHLCYSNYTLKHFRE